MRLFHETTYEALFDAGLDPFNVGGDRAACFMGMLIFIYCFYFLNNHSLNVVI